MFAVKSVALAMAVYVSARTGEKDFDISQISHTMRVFFGG
jgi:hypothetical protein